MSACLKTLSTKAATKVFFSIHIKYYNYKATFYYTTRLTMQHYRDDAKRSTGQ